MMFKNKLPAGLSPNRTKKDLTASLDFWLTLFLAKQCNSKSNCTHVRTYVRTYALKYYVGALRAPRAVSPCFVPVYCLLSTVYCLLSTVYCLLSTVYCPLSIVYCLLSTVSCLLSTTTVYYYFQTWQAVV